MRTVTFIHNTCFLSDTCSICATKQLAQYSYYAALIGCSTLSLHTFIESHAHKPVTVHLVHGTNIDYQCPICYDLFIEPLAEPFVTNCTHHLCRRCRDRLLDSNKTECPTCRKPFMLSNARCDSYLQRVVKDLKVYCSVYKEGCDWVGELRDLHDHLDPAKGGCGIACPFRCGKYARRIEMREHTRQCHKRMISCENCGYYNTFTIVTEKHRPICPRLPIDCLSQYLYNQAPMEFIISDYHKKKEADEEWYSSPFYTHNKGYTFRLKVYPNGDGTGSGSHLSVYTTLMRGEYDKVLAWPFEGDIRVELLNWKEDKNHHSDTLPFNRYNDPDGLVTFCVTDQETGSCDPHLFCETDVVGI